MVDTSKYCPTISENSNNLELELPQSSKGLDGWIIIWSLFLLEILLDNFSITSWIKFVFVEGNTTTLQYNIIDFAINKFTDLISLIKISSLKSLLKCSGNLISNDTMSNFPMKSIFSGKVPFVSKRIFKSVWRATSLINSGYKLGSPPVKEITWQSGVLTFSIAAKTSSTVINLPDFSDLLSLVSQ